MRYLQENRIQCSALFRGKLLRDNSSTLFADMALAKKQLPKLWERTAEPKRHDEAGTKMSRISRSNCMSSRKLSKRKYDYRTIRISFEA
jgi:hypothetical protein